MKVLSLFDGMACGALALQAAGIEIESYDAFEIDKYAIQTVLHNFPFIKQHGDVFDSSFTEFEGIDLLCGGSPCTHWSIAQKNNRETEAKGVGWDLFCQYVRALREAKPKYFLYENNKSMSGAIRESISDTFGFEPICINSALVSAQNRQRLYWVGKRNADGSYSKIEVEQPTDRGILLRDIIDSGTVDKEKAYCLKHQSGNARDYIKKHHTQVAFEPVCAAQRGRYTEDGNIEQVYEVRDNGKTNAVTTVQKDNNVVEPVIMNVPHGFNNGGVKTKKSPCITANGRWQYNNFISEPVNCTVDGKSHTIKALYYKNGNANFVTKGGFAASAVAEPIRVGSLPRPNGELSKSQAFRVYDIDGKSVNLTSNGGGAGAKTGLYAVPCGTRFSDKARCLRACYYKSGQRDFREDVKTDGQFGATGVIELCAVPTEYDESGKPIKALSLADQKEYTVYEVIDGFITFKGKQYPIKLADGFYIIRKLTVRECMRLQTVPEWYEFPVSDTQAYKMLGNGWTVDVIAHLISYMKEG